jgi:hypothetical protein
MCSRALIGMTMRHADGASARAVLSVVDAERPRCWVTGSSLSRALSGVKRRTPSVVVREPRTAAMSAENRHQAVIGLAVMIHEWWAEGQGRGTGAVGGSDQHGATAGGGR